MPTFEVTVIREMVGEYDAADRDDAAQIALTKFGEYREFFDTVNTDVVQVKEIRDES